MLTGDPIILRFLKDNIKTLQFKDLLNALNKIDYKRAAEEMLRM